MYLENPSYLVERLVSTKYKRVGLQSPTQKQGVSPNEGSSIPIYKYP
jgi:hypothetical protein